MIIIVLVRIILSLQLYIDFFFFSILEELLNSRIMVKNSIKKYAKQQPQDERLLRLLDARQLGLKLISNVTYGYTAAGFSGRMPCVDLADAIISKGRETLMEAMRLVHECQVELGGQVVYGDTDSIFICFQGCSVEEAFKRAAVLCDRITTSNPKPVKIKLEKIYSRSVLMTKKRYAGYCWESANDPHPQLECKGIETVRRDSIPLVKRVLDKGLRILFTSPETDRELLLNQLRSYFEHEFVQVLKNHRQRLHEFVFAREYRGQFGYRTGQLLPSIVIANHLVRKYGENCRPFSKQRVPYVICLGEHEKEPLAKLARLPLDFLHSNQMQLNCKYYIESVLIPPLQRVFGYLDVSISSWYQQLPSKARLQSGANIDCRVGRLTDYVQMKECTICAANIPPNSSIYSDIGTNPFPLCDGCLKKPQSCALHLVEYLREVECRFRRSSQICTLCQSVSDSPADCEALNCHNLFELQAARALMSKHSAHSDQLNEIAVHFYQSLQIYTKS